MRHLRGWSLLLGPVTAVAVTAGCGTTTGMPATPATAATTSSAAAQLPDLHPAQGDLTAALLATADLPGGYTTIDGGASPAGQLGGGVEQCGAAGGPTTAPSGASAAAQVFFQGGPIGPFLTESVTVTDGAQARESVAAMAQAASRCANFTGQVPGSAATMRMAIGQLSVGALGDATAAVRVTATVDGFPVTIHAHLFAVAYRGLLMLVVLAQLDEVKADDAEALARKAFEKLRKLGG
ncbi:hypothetical protein AB0K00_51850 [Dactylosporangium sp. NPDC049525]|uniref:hypothetical protein n=1 Tax=Dactylosporangium sp. NPDC049525 TaxID=3154730 RepID=UPI0034120083